MSLRHPAVLAGALVASLVVAVIAVGSASDQQRRSNNPDDLTNNTVSLPAASTTSQPAPTAPDTTPDPSASPTTMFGPSVWTVPVSELARDPRSDDWSARLWGRANIGAPGDWLLLSGIQQDGNDYSIPVYDAAMATTRRKVRRKFTFPGVFNVGPDDTIPWNDAWRPSDGNDGFLVILDSSTGHEWDLWNVSSPGYQTEVNDSEQCIIDDRTHPRDSTKRFDINADLCAASAVLITSPDGTTADLRSYRGNFPGAGGGGIQNGPGIVFPSEVAQGAVRHAWKLMIVNTMFGPECSPTERVDPAKFGVTCGSAVAPAGQFERVNGASQGGPARTETVPEGTRFALKITDAEIEAWLRSRGYSGARAETARIMAVSLRDYGWFITDSSSVGAGFTLAGAANPETQNQWTALGLTEDSDRSLLQGLFTRDRITVVAPPTNICADGTLSTFSCWASSTSYGS